MEILFKSGIIKSKLYVMKKFHVMLAILDRFVLKIMKH